MKKYCYYSFSTYYHNHPKSKGCHQYSHKSHYIDSNTHIYPKESVVKQIKFSNNSKIRGMSAKIVMCEDELLDDKSKDVMIKDAQLYVTKTFKMKDGTVMTVTELKETPKPIPEHTEHQKGTYYYLVTARLDQVFSESFHETAIYHNAEMHIEQMKRNHKIRSEKLHEFHLTEDELHNMMVKSYYRGVLNRIQRMNSHDNKPK